MNAHRMKAIALGEKLDSVETDIGDTARVKPTELKGGAKSNPNLDSLRDACKELLKDSAFIVIGGEGQILPVDLLALPDVKTPYQKMVSHNTRRSVEKMQKQLAPQIDVDSLYAIPFLIDGKTYKIPLRVTIKAKGGDLDWSVTSGEIVAPFVKEVVKTGSVDVGYSKWDLITVGLLLFVIGVFAGLLITLLRRI